ncbi:radical SAM protein [Chloroflexota bacterium]
MPAFWTNYLSNLPNLSNDKNILSPLVVTYYLTTRCNLNCMYCEEFGARRNDSAQQADFEQAIQILKIIRGATDRVVITGGEPMLHPQVEEILRKAKEELGFKWITMLSNGSLLEPNSEALNYLDHVVISLDSLNLDKWHKVIGSSLDVAESIFEHILGLATEQRSRGYRLSLNCVLTKDTLIDVKGLLNFCEKHDLSISFSPQAVDNWPEYGLVVSKEYQELLKWLLARKRSGAPIIGSQRYFATLIEFKPYRCYPLLAPRVMPEGDLIYPCRPIEKENDGRGGRINLFDFPNWQEAMKDQFAAYGPAPQGCSSCFQQCYAEPSLMQAAPVAWLFEQIRYPFSRQVNLASYPPG